MKSVSRSVALCAVFLALMIVLGALPVVFLLPVLLVCTLFKFRAAALAGLAYGLVSLSYAFMGASPISIAFISYPWVAIVPRVVAACGASLVHILVTKLYVKKDGRASVLISAGAAAITGSLLNTVLVLGSIYLFYGSTEAGKAVLLQTSIIMIYAIGEVAAQAILVPPLTLIMSKQLKRASKRGRAIKEEDML